MPAFIILAALVLAAYIMRHDLARIFYAFPETIASIASHPAVKVVAMGLSIVGAWLFPLPGMSALFFMLLGATIYDQLTGVQASKAEGKKITSVGWKRAYSKFLAYGGMLYVSKVAGDVIAFAVRSTSPYEIGDRPGAMLVAGALGWLTIGELISIVENIKRMGHDVPEWLVQVLRATKKKIGIQTKKRLDDEES